MRLSLAVVPCLALVGCFDMELDPCAPNHDEPSPSEATVMMSTTTDATVGEPLSVHVQYLVDAGESCTGDLGGTCKCTATDASPEEFEIIDVACDDDACDVERVGDYVAHSREVVIIPRRAMVSVRARVVSPSSQAPGETAVLTLLVDD